MIDYEFTFYDDYVPFLFLSMSRHRLLLEYLDTDYQGLLGFYLTNLITLDMAEKMNSDILIYGCIKDRDCYINKNYNVLR